MSPFPWTKPAPAGPRPTSPSSPRPGAKPTPSKPRPGRTAALAAQALCLIAVGLVLIVAALTAPTPPAAEPAQMWLRPATELERRDYDRQRLVDAFDELRQQEGATALERRDPGSLPAPTR